MNRKSCCVIAVTNQKGGVGKTTTAMNLAAGFAMRGFKTLAIDCDPHGNLTEGFGIHLETLTITVADLIEDRAVPYSSAIWKVMDGLELIGAHPLLAESARWMMTHTNGELRLKQRVNEMRQAYDVIVIDTCPGLGPILNSALNAADRLIIPADTGFFGYMGIQELHNEVEEIRRGGNPELAVLGYVLTMGERTILTRETREALDKRYGELVFTTVIRRCIALRESPVLGKCVFQHAPESAGAVDYSSLLNEILGRLGLNAMKKGEVLHV